MYINYIGFGVKMVAPDGFKQPHPRHNLFIVLNEIL